MPNFKVLQGDCREVLKTLADSSIDSVVTDPPYELGFMGKGWDRSGIAYSVEVWRECLRVVKPGGHLLAFGGSRTYHRLACAIEDAGFEIRDQIQWLYGSGFPKSLDVSKAIDAAAGAEREIVGTRRWSNSKLEAGQGVSGLRQVGSFAGEYEGERIDVPVTAPATEAAKQWKGWGTALKPAHEPIVLARKPLIGTVAENILQHGTGGLNIDGCRVELTDYDHEVYIPNRCGWKEGIDYKEKNNTTTAENLYRLGFLDNSQPHQVIKPNGRWPANVITDGSEEVLAGFPDTASAGEYKRPESAKEGGNGMFAGGRVSNAYANETGSAARFFYCAKASKGDREDGLDSLPGLNSPRAGAGRTNGSRNHHPTVKPTELTRYLCRLITPPKGTILDPFCGSGSTGRGAVMEKFNFIGIDLDAEYCQIARLRIEAAIDLQGSLFDQD